MLEVLIVVATSLMEKAWSFFVSWQSILQSWQTWAIQSPEVTILYLWVPALFYCCLPFNYCKSSVVFLFFVLFYSWGTDTFWPVIYPLTLLSHVNCTKQSDGCLLDYFIHSKGFAQILVSFLWWKRMWGLTINQKTDEVFRESNRKHQINKYLTVLRLFRHPTCFLFVSTGEVH